MICDRCEREWEGRPWIMADFTSGEVHGYCETCAVIKIDEYLDLKRKMTQQARNN